MAGSTRTELDRTDQRSLVVIGVKVTARDEPHLLGARIRRHGPNRGDLGDLEERRAVSRAELQDAVGLGNPQKLLLG